ncbi:hypothetical protein AWB81_06453 [Caballeronia arationis]|uniref:Cell wall surface anchor family protein n=2 Tax=Caballeronia arationis TaxID=1777142 RepID=A0A7Z7N2G6_9BURK|nr:hypothetical protein AWB81_06453 [Caballeronia arationis]SOE61837.1 hypothetical protein SAMN05446927_2189 [Caballeronia arationis]
MRQCGLEKTQIRIFFSARRLFRPPLSELMPDSAVKTAPQPDQTNKPSRTPSRRNGAASTASRPDGNEAAVSNDAEKKLARAARSAQRLAQLTSDPRSEGTLDLFAEDIERATFQAMNTDIRQGTLAGFELPDVFMAAVQSGAGSDAVQARRAGRTGAAVANDATLDVEPSGSAAAQARRGGKTASASVSVVRPTSATRSAAANTVSGDELALAMDEAPEENPSADPKYTDSKPVSATTPEHRNEPEAAFRLVHESGAASQGGVAEACPAPSSHAAALVDADRRKHRTGTAQRSDDPASPELDRARATAFADTIDALYAVTADQRASSTAHSRRMKTMLTIIVCAMLVTVATGVAQTLLLMRMSRDSALQQQRIEQLMLNQEATLSSLFDTDSANVSTLNALSTLKESPDASPVQPVSAARNDAAPKKHAVKHAAHRTGVTVR